MDDTEFDALFSGGSPLAKAMDVLRTANRNVCENEIDKLFERFCAYELYAEENGFDEARFSDYIYENQDEINNRKISSFMTLTADIVTRAE